MSTGLDGITGSDGVGWKFDGREFATEDEAQEAAWVDAFRPIADATVDLSGDLGSERPFTPGADGWLRPGTAAMFCGSKGEGKSDAALTACVDVVEAGGTAIYLDMENGGPRMADRLRGILSCRTEQVRADMDDVGAFRYVYPFDFRSLERPNTMRTWLQELSEEDVDLVVIDSFTLALGSLGIDEDSNSGVTQFVTKHIHPMTANGRTSVLMLDNTGHAGSRPRGASAKEQLFELVYKTTGGQTCAPDRHGTIKLKCTRWRDGDELKEMSLGFGGGRYGRIGAPPASDAGLLPEVRAELGGQTFASKNALYNAAKDAGIKSNKQAFWTLIGQWIEDPDSGVELDADSRYVVADGL